MVPLSAYLVHPNNAFIVPLSRSPRSLSPKTAQIAQEPPTPDRGKALSLHAGGREASSCRPRGRHELAVMVQQGSCYAERRKTRILRWRRTRIPLGVVL